jgi:pSer/pThr/pTyr-binding forkhead associated (FHA) protein
MYKLMVIAGPNRGTSFEVENGETSIGRQSGNSVVLASSKVSKRHCVLVASNGELIVRDEGSSNGTFVNGVLSKERAINVGDRISVGEFVLELTQPRQRTGLSLVSKSASHSPALPGVEGVANAGLSSHELGMAAEPQTLQEKALFHFDHFVMPFFYGLLLKNQWRLICMGVLAAFIAANLFISVSPLLESSRKTVVKETARRATFMARQIADQAGPLMASRAEGRVQIGAAETAEGVRLAAVTDMDNRIIAPSTRMNQYLTNGGEAVLLTKVRDLFRNGRETGVSVEIDSSTVGAVEPIKVYNSQTGKNATIGMAIVSIDTTMATMGLGDVGLVYSETFIISAILAGIALLILYRLTLKPLQILGDDMDKVLKGDMHQVTQEFKFEELNPLWDLINSALQRIPQGGGQFGGTGKVEPPLTSEDFVGPFRTLGSVAKINLAVCDGDRKLLHISSAFEDMSGIRSDNSIGQDFNSVARDQAMAAMVSDLFDRAIPGGEGVSEDTEFSGVAYKVWALSFGTVGAVKCYLLIAERAE